jgi:dihydrolipoamide dehydrogenase
LPDCHAARDAGAAIREFKEQDVADSYDVIVLGSGPGGYVAAIRAAQLGLKVAIVERENLGGICLNWGCIPTKALLRSAEVFHQMQHAKAYGLAADNIRADLAAVVARSRGVAKQLNQGVTHLMKKNRITVLMGSGALAGPGQVTVTSDKGVQQVAGKHVIVATGARARDLPFAKADGERIWTYRHAMTPKVLPSKLLVIGSGAIGIEFASFYNDMGSNVTVVEMLDRVVPVEDADVSAFLEKALTKQGMTIVTGAGVETLETGADGVRARIKRKDGQIVDDSFSHVIVAVGIVANTENIGLETVGLTTERGIIAIDGYGRTGAPGVWAIGDATPGPWLAHKASHEGVIAAEAIAAELGNADVHPHPMDRGNIPGCTYCRPQIASVGLTEARAKEAGYTVRAGTFPFIGNGKAIALGEAEGFVKTVFDAATGELLGAHMIGAEVTEMIQGFVIGKTLETTEAELMHTVFPHPTISESMHESVLAAYGRALHV